MRTAFLLLSLTSLLPALDTGVVNTNTGARPPGAVVAAAAGAPGAVYVDGGAILDATRKNSPLAGAVPVDSSTTPNAARTDSAVAVCDFLDATTFFESFHANYSDETNLTLLHEGKVRLAPLGTESIENFDWLTHKRMDQSWWQRIESLMYLLPLMASKKEHDKEFVRRWITGWLDAHENVPLLNRACKDAMTVAQRGMVLAWYLKQLQTEDDLDAELIDRIRVSLYWHQVYLEENYHAVSNHAMWEAMGLFETTRVCPNPKLAFVALQRALEITELSTTSQGFHTEQSTAYHFYFMRWLSDFAAYLSSLPGLEWPGLDTLSTRARSMKRMAYFLCDHGGRLAQIGDTDSMMIGEVWHDPPRSNATMAVDRAAGYAIFKDRKRSRSRRYVLFRILEHLPKLRFHTHDDGLSLYYSCDGEVILSDQGRYSYTRSPVRRYYTSLAAHNSIVPTRLLTSHGHRVYAQEPWWDQDGEHCTFGASDVKGNVTRFVDIPARGNKINVYDTILGDEPFSLLWYLGFDVVSIGECKEGVQQEDSTEQWHTYAWELTTAKRRRFLITLEILCGRSDDDILVHIIRGWEKPLLGWYSSTYKSSVPANVIRVDLNVQGYANVRTRIDRIR